MAVVIICILSEEVPSTQCLERLLRPVRQDSVTRISQRKSLPYVSFQVLHIAIYVVCINSQQNSNKCLCVLCCSSSISEKHAGDTLPTDSAAADLRGLRFNWLESQQRTLSFLCDACVIYCRKANDQYTVLQVCRITDCKEQARLSSQNNVLIDFILHCHLFYRVWHREGSHASKNFTLNRKFDVIKLSPLHTVVLQYYLVLLTCV